MARASKKNCQQTSQSGAGGGDGSSSVKNKGTFTHKTNEEKENVDPGLGGKMNGASSGPADVVRVHYTHVCTCIVMLKLYSLSLSLSVDDSGDHGPQSSIGWTG